MRMKSRVEINGAFVSYTANMARLVRDPAMAMMIAHDLGWSEEYLKGYNEGVKFVYEWVLGKVN
jgi:hypothetical protein